ncbi:MAG TPA: hypothetical protein VKU84_06980 [Stellaceae bacterium]|nr:hypothetical protein [Stellaceae bacterium]
MPAVWVFLVSAVSERGMFMVSGGVVIPVETSGPAEFLDLPAGDFGVLDRLALSHGTIIGRRSDRRLDLCLSGEAIDHKSLEAMLDRIEQCPPGLSVRLRWFLGGWLMETFRDPAAASKRLRQILSETLSVPKTRLQFAELDPATPCARTGNLFELWQRHAGHLSSDFIADAGKAGMLDRMFALEPDAAKGWIVRFMGHGIGIFSAQNRDVVGQPLESTSVDHDYTHWVEEHHASVLKSGASRYDHVDAILATNASRPTRVRYRRRLLPFRSYKGKPLVVGYSALTSDLALPL